MEKRTVICVINVGAVVSSRGLELCPRIWETLPISHGQLWTTAGPSPRGQCLHFYVTSRLRESESIACKGSSPKREGRAS